MDRRDFLGWTGRAAGAALAAISSAVTASGCAVSGLTVRPVVIRDRRILLPKADLPEPGDRGGVVQLTHPQLPLPVFLVLDPIDPPMALSAECMHMGCPVEFNTDGFICHCHGSAYRRDGTVANGPAARPLRRLDVREESDRYVITLPAS